MVPLFRLCDGGELSDQILGKLYDKLDTYMCLSTGKAASKDGIETSTEQSTSLSSIGVVMHSSISRVENWTTYMNVGAGGNS
ncbi:hypothetical protein M8C21_020443 [Ambrosia artemisiifolia]|uniref:Uncharacterized protein n=1 Tax=Ambrosia artemisiifolia TaxID=4212 RepID=A0AAD5G4R5_AMBAR|nr:hypothetical protein M8C21_020443 [Ambrosia artemisiifolia]